MGTEVPRNECEVGLLCSCYTQQEGLSMSLRGQSILQNKENLPGGKRCPLKPDSAIHEL